MSETTSTTPPDNAAPSPAPIGNAVAEHAFTIPMFAATVASTLTVLATNGLITSELARTLGAAAAAICLVATMLGQLWQSIHVRRAIAVSKLVPRPVEPPVAVTQGEAARASFKAPTTLALLFIPFLFLGGCGFCRVPANTATPRCIAERTVTDCGAPEVVKIVIDIAASVGQALVSSDWGNLVSAIETDLEHRGVTDVWGVLTCAVNHVEGTSGGAKGAPTVYIRGEAWKKRHPAKVQHASTR